MQIVWDEFKRQINVEKHGLDFADLEVEFFESAIIAPAKSGRLKALGAFGDGIIAVIIAVLGTEGISIISMRQASKPERTDMLNKKNIVLKEITDEEEARIQRGIALDPDNPEWTAEDFKKARPFADVFPELMESIRRARGRPASETPRKVVSLRLDQDVLEKYRATGKGWQARMNADLRKASGL